MSTRAEHHEAGEIALTLTNAAFGTADEHSELRIDTEGTALVVSNPEDFAREVARVVFGKERMVEIVNLERFQTLANGDKDDLELTCTECEGVLCDVEPHDGLDTLARIASEHECTDQVTQRIERLREEGEPTMSDWSIRTHAAIGMTPETIAANERLHAQMLLHEEGYDLASSRSSQHFIDTGRYLLREETGVYADPEPWENGHGSRLSDREYREREADLEANHGDEKYYYNPRPEGHAE
jgi:hypothetical protein